MNDISIFGTSSDAGKSTLAFAITYLLHQRGIKVAPFKAQNVSNNSQVTDADIEGGREIAIPQHFAANAINIKTTPSMNPVLIKSGANGRASLVVNGKSVGEKDIAEYFQNIATLKPIVKEAFLTLKEEYDCIVAEGAGSPVELNLMQKDLSNIYIAKKFNTKIIIVADIERGGVFASIYGVYNLLPKKLRKNVIGVIINKFQGDMKFFKEGVKIIENEFKLKVLGVVPFKPFNLGFEDSASLMNYRQNSANVKVHVAVINLPHMSNFTDFEALVADSEVHIEFVHRASKLDTYDLIVLPGSKLVVADLEWLKKEGFSSIVKRTDKKVVGICGGYEMMFESIIDIEGIESSQNVVKGLGIFTGSVVLKEKKVLKKEKYKLFGCSVDGYEIHHGQAKQIAMKSKNYYGTFVHGLFDSDTFRKKLFSKINSDYVGFEFKKFKKEAISLYAHHIDENIDMDYITHIVKKEL